MNYRNSATSFSSSLALSLALWAAAITAHAQAPQAAQPPAPSAPGIRIMVGAAAGGGTDLIARVLAEHFSKGLHKPVVVENKPGASNTLAAEATAKATPDGTTLLVASTTGQAIAPNLIKLAYDPIKDIKPVGMLMLVPNVLVVSSKSPVKNVRELVDGIHKSPKPFKYASSGIGSTQHIVGEAFALRINTKMSHVAYRGSSLAHEDVANGSVQLMFDTASSALQTIKAGKFKPLAVTTALRSQAMPEVPTLKEAGFDGIDMSTWYGLYVTGGTPDATVKQLADELKRVMALPEVKARIRELGGNVLPMYGETFTRFNLAEYVSYKRLITQAKITAE